MKIDPQFPQVVDITPTPRILRTLGDIPFSAWQCLAELIDNSLDAFSYAESIGSVLKAPRIDIVWSSDHVAASEREIVIQDNGFGMSLDTLQKAAKAGYSSNDPIHSLGLFGMGFNISTARLGDETLFLSTIAEASEWVGIKIGFEQLIRQQTFSAPVVWEQKRNPGESGTKIIIKNIKEGMFTELRKKESAIRRQLEVIYTPILSRAKVSIYVQGKKLSPRPHCVWAESRFVVRKGVRVYAIQKIDRDLGVTYFDTERNRYLSEGENAELDILISRGGVLPTQITRRSRHLTGWIGIQRFADPTSFGLDFVRNGRKILVSDKSLFGYENPDTGTYTVEYPVELGSTVGGRIVGELHVDYMIPSYQKNSFDSTERAWRLTVEAIRGAGPILPMKRQALGYDGDNESPLAVLVNAYRRTDPGTKNLAIRNADAREFAKRFDTGDPKYRTDDVWYRVAQECDRERGDGETGLTSVNRGFVPSDDISLYLPAQQDDDASSGVVPSMATQQKAVRAIAVPEVPDRDNLILNSDRDETLTAKYAYGNTPSIHVTAWRLREGQIKIQGMRVPYLFFQDGVEVDFFFDLTHPIISEYPLSPKQLLLQGVAERFSLRDRGTSTQVAFIGLVENHMIEERINPQALQERAHSIISHIREKLPILLSQQFYVLKQLIQAVEAEEEELAKRLLAEAPQLLQPYQNSDDEAKKVLAYVSEATIPRLISAFPHEFLDGKLFLQPYSNVTLGSDSMRDRLRQNSVNRVLSYLSDVIFLLQSGKPQNKAELMRHAHTLSLLEGLLV